MVIRGICIFTAILVSYCNRRVQLQDILALLADYQHSRLELHQPNLLFPERTAILYRLRDMGGADLFSARQISNTAGDF